jgi:hypothetical protein
MTGAAAGAFRRAQLCGARNSQHPQPAAAAARAAGLSSTSATSAGSVRQCTPTAVILAQMGERPLWLRWLQRAAKLWNQALLAQPDSLLRQEADASIPSAQALGSRVAARQPWALQG